MDNNSGIFHPCWIAGYKIFKMKAAEAVLMQIT
jgi:hypothetical protein